MVDEPAIGRANGEGEILNTPEQIRELLEEHRYGVLCTQGQSQPFGSVVAYTCTGDLRSIVFATPRTTRKFQLLVDCPNAALVVHDTVGDSIMDNRAVTACGSIAELANERRQLAVQAITLQHPALRAFTRAPTTAVLELCVARYCFVARFQQVDEWTP